MCVCVCVTETYHYTRTHTYAPFYRTNITIWNAVWLFGLASSTVMWKVTLLFAAEQPDFDDEDGIFLLAPIWESKLYY
jgi:hypothetical protein